MKKTSTRRQLPYTILGIIFLAIMIFPVYWMVNSSLQGAGAATNSSWFPLAPTLDGYVAAIRDQGANLVTSLIIALGSVIVVLVIATPAAYALAKFRLRWINGVLIALLISQMIPGIVIANALYTAYNDLGLLNSYPGLMFADATNGIPFAILILRAFMLSIPPSLVEAARVDGAGHFRAFMSIILPISRNSIITAGLFAFLFSWSDFVFALTLTTSASVKPVTLGIYSYLSANIQSWGPVMATAVLSSLPAIVLLLAAQRFIAGGALSGAVK